MLDFSRAVRRIGCGLLVLSALAGCDGQWWHNIPGYQGEWWNRGKPKSVAQLLDVSHSKFLEASQANIYKRDQFLPLAKDIEQGLLSVQTKLKSGPSNPAFSAELGKLVPPMLALEGKLSIGSRAAYGELAGQLRSFIGQVDGGQDLGDQAFNAALNLYTARTFFFLANELEVPAPLVVAAS